MTAYEIYCSLKKEKGVTDAEVSKSTGIGKSTFSDWKSGRSKPKTEKLSKIADFFEVPYTYLIGTSKERSTLQIEMDKRRLEDLAPIIKKYESTGNILKVDDIKIYEVEDGTIIDSDGVKLKVVRKDSDSGKSPIKNTIETAKNSENHKLTEDEKHIIKLYRSGKYKEIVSLMMEKMP